MSKGNDFNKVTMMGNLGDDPVIKEFSGGRKLALFSIALNRSWKDDKGEHKKTTWVDCRLGGKGAEIFQQYMKKGRRVLIEGSLELDKWTDEKTGEKREKLRVNVNEFHFADSRRPENGTTSVVVAPEVHSAVETVPTGYVPDTIPEPEMDF